MNFETLLNYLKAGKTFEQIVSNLNTNIECFKNYVYYDNGWKFSSGVGVNNKPEQARIVKVNDLTPTPVKFTWTVFNGVPTVSMEADTEYDIYYTVSGGEPTTSSIKYICMARAPRQAL